MSPLRSRKSSARFSYEDIENTLRDVENVTSRSETENQESDSNHRNHVDYNKTEMDSTEEEGTTSSTSAEPAGRYTVLQTRIIIYWLMPKQSHLVLKISRDLLICDSTDTFCSNCLLLNHNIMHSFVDNC